MRVLVLAGGDSEEKSVSLAGGLAVHAAIKQLPAWESTLVDPAAESWWNVASDIVFPVLHGAGGEDGSLQKQLEDRGQLFVGSGSLACQLTFDKSACAAKLSKHSMPCPAEITVDGSCHEGDWEPAFQTLRRQSPETKRWVVKPNQQGSSVGVSVVQENSKSFQADLNSAIRLALRFDKTCLIQQYIAGREITVSMLDGEALSPIEICVPSGFYDFHAKYQSSQTVYRVVDDDSSTECCKLAKRIHRFCGTQGIVRIDFRVDESGQPWFLELNTIPGMTERSLVPKSAAAWNWTLTELCRRAVMNEWNRQHQGTSAS